jgi:hypothetical protein
MVSQLGRVRALTVAAAVVALALAGCAPKSGADAGTQTPFPTPTLTASPTPTPTAPATQTPGPTTGPDATDAPDAPAPTGAPVDTAGAKALAVQACQQVADGFAATRVAAATPLAAAAAAKDGVWKPLAANLAFINANPINPETGAGPQKTVDDSSAVARDCFTLAGVTVSQD